MDQVVSENQLGGQYDDVKAHCKEQSRRQLFTKLFDDKFDKARLGINRVHCSLAFHAICTRVRLTHPLRPGFQKSARSGAALATWPIGLDVDSLARKFRRLRAQTCRRLNTTASLVWLGAVPRC